VVAHIKPANVASIRTFERTGFRFTGEVIFEGQSSLEYVLEAGRDVQAKPSE
jgi:RimJ/RimL family protein N-acetyltransferase